uniref:Uncharacterized protein n=1 Tax=Anguilla anguilla TaxID=7936 RepID=A0A0E9VLY8_ANGAN
MLYRKTKNTKDNKDQAQTSKQNK